MASDVEDLTNFYAHLPSIFDNRSPASTSEPSYDEPKVSHSDQDKAYQSIFGSFLFADSDPLSKAVFVESSIQGEALEEQPMNNRSPSDSTTSTVDQAIVPELPSPLASPEDLDDEDDFDGIPVRHAPTIVKSHSDTLPRHPAHHYVLNESTTMSPEHHELDIDEFFNDLDDDDNDPSTIVPSLFRDIPDIDDPNGHEAEEDDGDDDRNRLAFDAMDMFDQSDSIRSSSPDSLLSSSHLNDEPIDDDDDDDDDVEDDHEVTHWNEFTIFDTVPTKVTDEHPPSAIHSQLHPFDQVNFIDSSRSNSRCSNVSSHLSGGYADQARMFLSDDGLVTSSESEDDDDDDDDRHQMVDLPDDTFVRDDSDEPRLHVILDERRSRSSSPSSSDDISRDSPLSVDQSPIGAIDDEHEPNPVHIAPIAALDDDDDLPTFMSDQPILPLLTSSTKTWTDLKGERRRTDIAHDILHIRQLLNDHDDDDEFIAVMHNPSIFEQVLHEQHDDQKVISIIYREERRKGRDFDLDKQASGEMMRVARILHEPHECQWDNEIFSCFERLSENFRDVKCASRGSFSRRIIPS